MDKISGILPEKPRLKSDSETMAPVRPGAPAFGRSEGSSELHDRVSLSSVKNIGPQEFQNYRNPKEAKNVQIVDELSKKFFLSQAKNKPKTGTSVETPKNSPVLIPQEKPVEKKSMAPLEMNKPSIDNNEEFTLPPEFSMPQPTVVEPIDYYA